MVHDSEASHAARASSQLTITLISRSERSFLDSLLLLFFLWFFFTGSLRPLHLQDIPLALMTAEVPKETGFATED